MENLLVCRLISVYPFPPSQTATELFLSIRHNGLSMCQRDYVAYRNPSTTHNDINYLLDNVIGSLGLRTPKLPYWSEKESNSKINKWKGLIAMKWN